MNRRTLAAAVIVVLAISTALLSAYVYGLGRSQGSVDQPKPSISVTGEGWADVRPDLAAAQIGVQTRDQDAGRAVEANNQKAQAVIEAIRALGIAEADILTSQFSVYGQEGFDKETGEPSGAVTYIVDNTVSVTIRDLSQVGPVLDAALGAGANTVQNLSFTVEDQTAALREARDKALADAKARAEQIAQGAGIELGSLLNLSESQFGGPIPLAEAVRAEGLGGRLAAVALAPVSSGTFRVQLQVYVTYEIK